MGIDWSLGMSHAPKPKRRKTETHEVSQREEDTLRSAKQILSRQGYEVVLKKKRR